MPRNDGWGVVYPAAYSPAAEDGMRVAFLRWNREVPVFGLGNEAVVIASRVRGVAIQILGRSGWTDGAWLCRFTSWGGCGTKV
ncbi:hypothetical protein [Govanella unica]|uniref:Uncharacterized protein n=1 Tax=Govanella unica TaxID=2975056 RepID=A0A9X3U0S0_9PROT|nr:hypothetical protein [Govania unica]MDA5194917.1 hypothetical protein [Govania unica]